MKSFIGWIGGKSRLRNQIISLIPTDCSRYIEVCGGAGWVLFGKEKVKGQMEVFNDVDGDLINLYKQIKYNCSELQVEIDWLQSRELFNQYRYEIENQIKLSDLQRAARYLSLLNVVLAAIETRLLLIQNQYAILLMSYQHTKKG